MNTWLFDTLVATSALIVAVLVLRRTVADWFGPRIAYSLWAIPALRLVMPPIVLPKSAADPSTTAAEPIVARAVEAGAGATTFMAPAAQVSAPSASQATEPAAFLTSALIEAGLSVWLGVALAVIAWRLHGYFSLRREVLRDARPVAHSGEVKIIETAAIRSPMAFGILEKYIALPAGFFAGADEDAVELAIAHELEHHRAGDLAANMAMELAVALLWFNPLAWIGRRAMLGDQEAACDARVLEAAGAESKARYAELIAAFACDRRYPLASQIGGKAVLHRLRCIARRSPSARRGKVGKLAVLVGACAVPATATVTYAASGEGFRTILLAPGAAVATGQAMELVRDELQEEQPATEPVAQPFGESEPTALADARAERSVHRFVDSSGLSYTQAVRVPSPPRSPAPPAPPRAPGLTHVVYVDAERAEAMARMQPIQLECDGKVFTVTVAQLETRQGERKMEAYAQCVERHALRAEARAVAQAEAGLEQGRIGLIQARNAISRSHFASDDEWRETVEEMDEDIRDMREEIRELRRERR